MTKKNNWELSKVDENNSHYAVFNIHDRNTFKNTGRDGLQYERKRQVGEGHHGDDDPHQNTTTLSFVPHKILVNSYIRSVRGTAIMEHTTML